MLYVLSLKREIKQISVCFKVILVKQEFYSGKENTQKGG